MFTKTQILASIAANGLAKIGANKWTDGTHEYSIRKAGDAFDVKCKRTAPWPGMNVAMREASRPAFFATRKVA